MIALCTVPTSPLNALQSCLADAEHRALQVKRLALAINSLIGDPQSQACAVAIVERLTELADDATKAFEDIDRHLCAVISSGATA
jgi:hypothetical protein